MFQFLRIRVISNDLEKKSAIFQKHTAVGNVSVCLNKGRYGCVSKAITFIRVQFLMGHWVFGDF